MNPSIKLYAPRAHYNPAQRAELAEILRPFWKETPFSDAQRRELYGVSEDDFHLVDSVAAADLAVLPMTWNHYLSTRQFPLALRFVQAARRAHIPVLSYVSGDAGVTVPAGLEDVYVVRASGSCRRCRDRQVAQPVFFLDPWQQYSELRLDFAEPAVRSDRRPVVGFCGQAKLRPNRLRLAGHILQASLGRVLYHLRLSWAEPQPLMPPAWLRSRALQLLTASPQVRTSFRLRNRYRGGAADPAARARMAREFYRNVAAADYTLCVRGGGNFSKRFYETLALGRIPVLLDTDCLLPFAPSLPWDDFIVRVPSEDLSTLPQVIANHFGRLEPEDMAERRRVCRQLWEEWLSFAGFHRRLMQYLLPAPISMPAPGSLPEGRIFD